MFMRIANSIKNRKILFCKTNGLNKWWGGVEESQVTTIVKVDDSTNISNDALSTVVTVT